MKAVVLGSGFQGVACVWDLIQSPNVERVLLVDQNPSALNQAKAKISSPKLEIREADITQFNQAVSLMREGSVTVSAVPYFFNEQLTQAAIEAGCHMVDMGGNTDLVFKQMEYSPQAQAAGVTIIPDMGLAPGFANLLAAELIEKFESVENVEIRVGGLPQNPRPPLDYQLFFSVEGLINEYIGPCTILGDGKRTTVKSLTGVEALTFPDPVGPCEAFHTLGGSSTMPWTYEGRVKNLNYKTVRYPGHCEKLVLLEDLGFFETDPIQTRDGQKVSPRQVTAALLNRKLYTDEPRDFVVVRVTVQGTQAGKPVEEIFEILDRYDTQTGFTAMMRTTAFPVSIVAQLLGGGKIPQPGVFPPERVVPVGVVREEMARRGIETRHRAHQYTQALVHS